MFNDVRTLNDSISNLGWLLTEQEGVRGCAGVQHRCEGGDAVPAAGYCVAVDIYLDTIHTRNCVDISIH